MIFYTIFAIGLLFSRRAFGYAFTLAVLGLAALAGQMLHPHQPILAFYTSPIVLEFGAGMLLGMLFTGNKLPFLRTPAIVTGAVAFIAILAGPSLWPGVDRSIAAGIPAVLIVASAVIAERAGFVCTSAWIQLLGAASYSIYLTHFFATQVMVKIADRIDAPNPGEVFAFWVAAMALVIGVGVAVHRIAELPLTASARRLLGGRRKIPPAAALAVTQEAIATNG
jgi:exopolysaccharide production protein ExoZ